MSIPTQESGLLSQATDLVATGLGTFTALVTDGLRSQAGSIYANVQQRWVSVSHSLDNLKLIYNYVQAKQNAFKVVDYDIKVVNKLATTITLTLKNGNGETNKIVVHRNGSVTRSNGKTEQLDTFELFRNIDALFNFNTALNLPTPKITTILSAVQVAKAKEQMKALKKENVQLKNQLQSRKKQADVQNTIERQLLMSSIGGILPDNRLQYIKERLKGTDFTLDKLINNNDLLEDHELNFLDKGVLDRDDIKNIRIARHLKRMFSKVALEVRQDGSIRYFDEEDNLFIEKYGLNNKRNLLSAAKKFFYAYHTRQNVRFALGVLIYALPFNDRDKPVELLNTLNANPEMLKDAPKKAVVVQKQIKVSLQKTPQKKPQQFKGIGRKTFNQNKRILEIGLRKKPPAGNISSNQTRELTLPSPEDFIKAYTGLNAQDQATLKDIYDVFTIAFEEFQKRTVTASDAYDEVEKLQKFLGDHKEKISDKQVEKAMNKIVFAVPFEEYSDSDSGDSSDSDSD